MATPNSKGGWDLSDADIAEMQAMGMVAKEGPHASSDTGTTVPIQRYFFSLDGFMEPDDNGQFVGYKDHVQAVAAAVAKALERRRGITCMACWFGQDDPKHRCTDLDRCPCIDCHRRAAREAALREALAAVEALPSVLNCWDRYGFHIEKNDATAVLQRLIDGGNE